MKKPQRVNTALVIAMYVVTSWSGLALGDDVEDDIVIGSLDGDANEQPPVVRVAKPKPTEEEIFRQKMRRALPYFSLVDTTSRLKTLGQLSKMCDYVVIGKVVSLDNKDNLVLNVETVLFGDIPFRKFFPSRRISIAGGWWISDERYEKTIKSGHPISPCPWRMEKRPASGDRLLVFLSAGPSPEYVLPYHWEPDPMDERRFDFRKKENLKQGEYHLTRGGTGAKGLNTPENATNYLNAVSGYLKELRGEKRDAESYYSLLRNLVQSPVQSIREDARSDLMYFIEYCPPFDARRLLTDDHIDEAIKHWVEHDVIPGREPTRN